MGRPLVIESSRQGKRKEEPFPWRVTSSQYAEPKNGTLVCREVTTGGHARDDRSRWGMGPRAQVDTHERHEYPQRKLFTRFQ